MEGSFSSPCWQYLKQIEGGDRQDIHARQIPESLCDPILLAVYHQGSLAADVPPVPHLTLASPDVTAVLCLLGILVSTNLEESCQVSIKLQ